MKLIPFVLSVLVIGMNISSANALTHKYPCDKLLFDAMTTTGKKRVQLCLSKGQLNYNFGLTNGKSELDTLVPLTSAVLHTRRHSDNPEPAIELFIGDYGYTVFPNVIMVARGEIHKADIELDTPIYNDMLKTLLPTGIPVT